MPPIQKTFTIIPQGPSLAPGAAAGQQAIRPMTSKQVRKAYKAANKGPSMSRADRVKWERAEQERIRKEFEKEKAAAKARAARERKKEKELAEREHKRRIGLPTVSVRPSQDTIARFVRGNGSGRKRDSDGLGIDEKPAHQLSAIEEVMGQEQTSDDEKLPKQEQEESDEALIKPLQATGLGRTTVSTAGPVKLETDDLSLESKKGGKGQDGDKTAAYTLEVEKPQDLHSAMHDDFGVDMLEDDMFLIDAEPTKVDFAAAATTTQSNGPQKNMFPEMDLISEGDDFELDMLAIEAMTQQKQPDQHSESHDLTHISDRYCKAASASSSIEKDLGIDMACVLDTSRLEPPAKPPDKEHSMGPPPLPVAQSPRHFQSVSVDQQPQEPPLSTQAIFSNVDDFFPTASQLELELEEDAEPVSRKSTPFSDPWLSPLANHQPPYHVAKPCSPINHSKSPSYEKHPQYPSNGGEVLPATSHRSHEDASSRTRRDKDEPVHKKAETNSPIPGFEKPRELSPELRLTSKPNQRSELIYLAEKRLAAIRQENMPPKASPKTQKQAQKRPLKPMVRNQPLKDVGKAPPVSSSSSMTQKCPPPAKLASTSHNTSKETAHPPPAFTSITNKENMLPPAGASETIKCIPTASQESYGGDWVDEAALELMM